MDPITVATIALTLVATKATEKVGEQLGEGVIASTRNLLEVLRRKSPDTVKRLESQADDPDVIDAEIIEEVQQVAASEPEVREALDVTAQAMQQQFGSVINQGKLAEKIGILIQGGYNSIRIEKFEV
ncbi:MAG: hypothetical protein HC840_12800 [Leptolyngbyaceae cyanobacterium RM2_2_4]|nr:hypothetical protein [Leptolyngbyaceae cyanobacterium RM2_2_4]